MKGLFEDSFNVDAECREEVGTDGAELKQCSDGDDIGSSLCKPDSMQKFPARC